MTGTITTLKADKLFGFIAPSDGSPDCFFHRNDLVEPLTFDGRLQERRVQFDVVNSEKGPRAKNVRAAT
jgi:cold shock protein